MNKREEEKLKKQQERLEKEIARTKAMSTFEEEYKDYPYICGIDEVGRWTVGRSGRGRSCDSAQR